MSKFVSSITEAFFDSDFVATRCILFLSELMWSIMLFWPGHVFSRPTYHFMSEIATEGTWGIVFLIAAVCQLSIVVNQSYISAFARYFALANAFLWGFVVISMLRSVYPPPAAIAGEISLALAAAWIWVRPFILISVIRKSSDFAPLA